MKEDFLYLRSYPELPLNIALAGISYCDGSYHIKRPHSNVTVIEYILEGEGYILTRGKKIKVTADNIYILKEGDDQEYYSCSHNPWKKIFINFSGQLGVDLLVRYGLDQDIVFEGTALKYIFERIREIIQTGDDSSTSHATLCASYYEILANLAINKKYPKEDSEASKLKRYLEKNTHRIVTNSELAATIYRSTDYTIKLFSSQYRITPYEYQINEKMIIARHLLKNTAISIAEIGNIIGYTDPHYFSGLFKKRNGISPKAYRRN